MRPSNEAAQLLRSEPSPSAPSGPPDSAATDAYLADDSRSEPPDPWELLPEPAASESVAAESAEIELGLTTPADDGYRGRRRVAAGRADGTRRLVLVVAAVAAVLVGSGALAKALPEAPVAFPAPPTPPAVVDTSPPQEDSRLGSAPSATGTPTPASSATSAPSRPVTPAPAAPSPSPPPSERPTPTPMVRSHEAESAELSGFVRIFSMTEASGGAVVGMIGQHRDSYVRFTDVTVAEAGEYELTFHYVGTQSRPAMVSINDGDLITIDFPALQNGNEVGELRIPVELVAGRNEIWFGNLDRRAPALDRITVTG